MSREFSNLKKADVACLCRLEMVMFYVDFTIK